ncbi:hypothetical protein I4U23_022597 [Adineta vaga]|nr:hypothetical protein I4U23_022597 [Adineta vaga]
MSSDDATIATLLTIQEYLQKYFSLFIIFITSIGNICNFIVFLYIPPLNKHPNALFVIASAIGSFIFVNTALWSTVINMFTKFNLTNQSLFWCKVYTWFYYSTGCFSFMCHCFAALGQCLLVSQTILWQQFLTRTKTKVIIIITAIIWLLIFIPLPLFNHLVRTVSGTFSCRNSLQIISAYANYWIVVGYYLLPTLLIFILIILTFYYLRQLLQRRRHIEGVITRMMLIQMFVILLSGIPAATCAIYSIVTMKVPKTRLRSSYEATIYLIFILLTFLTNGASFWIYLFTSATFRKHIEVNGARWTPEKANAWYAEQPWYFGANFVPSSSVNVIDMWRTFDTVTIERELEWASSINMNVMRVFLHVLFYQQDAAGYLEKINDFLTIADRFKIKVIFVLFDECWRPDPKLGPQPEPIPGQHNSQWVRCPGQALLLDQSKWFLLKRYTRDILSHFSTDSRVVIWDLYNEPQGSHQVPIVLPLLHEIYSAAIAADPNQPLTFGIAGPLNEPLAQFELETSDIISFHNYSPLDNLMEQVTTLRQFNRPLICTEYMARTIGSTFHTHTVYFYKENIGAVNWGLVAGKTQTYFPWGSPVNASIPLVWFHDIFNASGKPYSIYEVQFFKDLQQTTLQSFLAKNLMKLIMLLCFVFSMIFAYLTRKSFTNSMK